MQGIDALVCNASNFLRAPSLQRMRYDQGAHALQAACPRRGGGQVGEHLGDDDHGWNAAPLTLDRVVDTPRRARPSCAEADDGRIDGAHEARHLLPLLVGGSDANPRVEEHDIAHGPVL